MSKRNGHKPIFSRKALPVIRVHGGPPECPLCGKRMKEYIFNGAIYFICVEPMCMISIRKDDLCCGKWLDKWPEAAPKCPLCQDPMRWFFRVDGYVKLQCQGKGSKAHRFFQIIKGNAEHLPPLKGTE